MLDLDNISHRYWPWSKGTVHNVSDSHDPRMCHDLDQRSNLQVQGKKVHMQPKFTFRPELFHGEIKKDLFDTILHFNGVMSQNDVAGDKTWIIY